MLKPKHILFFFSCILFNSMFFGQVPSNDDCSSPTQITPSSSCAITATTLANATSKAPLVNPDVWYSFVATSTTHSIGVVKTKDLNTTSKIFKPIIELFNSKCATTVITSLPIDGSTQINQSDKQERTYTGLVVGQTYYYRVYNIGSGSTLFNFDTYVCETINSGNVNDEISNAVELPISTICDLKAFSITGSTPTSPSKTISGTSNQNADVWFKVTVPSNGNLSVILQSLGIQGEYALVLYRGNTYTNLTELSTDVFNSQNNTVMSLYKTGLTPNETLYIRVCVLTNTTTRGVFKICASTPPSCGNHTPAGDNCANATRICDLNGYCGNTSKSYTIDEPSNLKSVLSTYQSNISIENNSWLSFIANATSATFTIYVSNCIKVGGASTATGIQVAILEASNCSNFVTKANFFSPGQADNGMITATNLTIGKEYLIMIDGADGANCDYTITTNSGVVTIDAGPDQIYCNPATIPLNLNATGAGASTITWDARVNNTLNSNIASGASATINPGPTQNTTYIVKASGTCAGAVDSLNVTIQNCICVKPTITVQPQNQTACSGNNVNFTFTSNGITYQWKESKDNGVSFSPLSDGGLYSGTKTASLSINGITSAYNGYLYKCIVIDATGKCSDSTNAVSITITPLTTINSSKIDFCKGNSITLSAVTNPPANYSFVWKVPTGVTDPGNVNSFSTSTAGTYTVNVFAPNNLLCNSDFEDNQVTTAGNYSMVDKAQISCWNTTATDNKIEVWNNGFQGVPSFSGKQFIELNGTQAATLYQDISVIPGGLITLSFAHRGRSGIDKMEVQIGAINGTFTSLGTYSDNNTAWGFYTVNYTVPANSPTTLRLKFTPISSSNNDLSFGNFLDAISIKTTSCAILSNEFILTEKSLPTAQITGEATVCKDDTPPTLTLTGNDGTAPYIFTYSLNNGVNQTITSSGNTATLNIPTNTIGSFSYQLISVKESSTIGCSQNQTGTKNFKVIPISVGGTLTNNQTICSGNAPTSLNVTGYIGSITKWQSSEAPYNSWTDIANTTSTYSPGNLSKSTKFRVEVKNDICSPVYSNEITISVDELAVGGTVSSDQTICETIIPNTLNLSGHSGQISKWQFSISPFTAWSDITNTTNTFSPSKLTQSTKYRAVIKSGVCPEVFAKEAIITVKTLEKLNVSCGVSSMTDVEFTWSDVSDETSYNYTYTVAGGSSNTGTASTDLTSVSIPVTAQGQTVQLTLTPTGASCAQPETQSCISQTCLTPVTDQISDINVCTGETITIPSFSSPDSPTSYTWSVNYPSFSIGNSGNTNIAAFTSPLTNSKITAVFSVNALKSGCVGPTMKFKVVIHPLPILNLTNDGPICIGSRPIQLNENSGNVTSWSWSSNGNGSFSSTTIQNPTINNPANGEIITVTAKDANNCSNSATTTLVINPLPNINAGSDQTSCSGNPITLNASGGTTYTWDNNIVDDVAFTPNATTTYTVTGTDMNGCKNTDQVIVNVNTTPLINDVNLRICSELSFTVSPTDNTNGQRVPNGTNYTWNTSSSFNITGASNQITAQNNITATLSNSSSSAEIVSYKVNAANGTCNSSFTINVNVNPLPSFTPSARSKCINEALYVKANASSVSNLTWTGPNGFSKNQTNDDEILVTNNAQANQHQGEYSVTVTDINGCINTQKMMVSITPLPIINAGQDVTICLNELVTLKGSGGVIYSWDNQVQDGISFAPTLNTTYTVTGTDANGCSNTDQVSVTVNSLPNVSAGTDLKICMGESITLSGSGADSYVWDNNISDNSAFKPNQTTTYTVIGTDANNCHNSDEVIVTVNDLPTIDAGLDQEICYDSTIVLQATGGVSYVWDNNITDGISFKPNNTTKFTVIGKDVNGCENSDDLVVTVNQLPPVFAGNDKSICTGSSVTLSGGGAVSYSWDNNVTDNVAFSSTTTKTYIVTGTDAKGCKNTDEVVVTVNPLPDFSLSVNDPCEQAILEFSVDLTNNPSTAGVFSSNWNGPNGFIATSLNPTISNVTANATGVYNLTITDNNQCARTKSINALVNLVDNIQFADIAPKCINDDPFLLPIPNIIGGSWASDDNTSIQNPLTGLFEPKKSKPDQEYKVVVTYSTKSIIPARKCPATLSKVVFVNPIPDSTFYAKNPVLCIDDTLHLVINQPNKNVNYTWDLGNGTLIKQNTQNLDYNYPKDGDFTIKLIAELGNCKVSETKQAYVHVIPKPTLVDFTQSDTEIDFYNPEIQFKSYTNGKYLFWNFGDGTYSNYKNPTHKFPENPGEYIIDLTASNMENNACSKTVTRSIFMPEPVIYFIPNTFTPNGDELNNVFQPVFTFGYDPQNYGFYIYDRWGELLFESHDTKIGWDGTYGNQIVQNDTYIWKLEFKEKLKEDKHSKVGHVDLLR